MCQNVTLLPFLYKVILSFNLVLLTFASMNIKPHIPQEFADFCYLRSIDLMPKPLSEFHGRGLDIEECRKLYKQGLLFLC